MITNPYENCHNCPAFIAEECTLPQGVPCFEDVWQEGYDFAQQEIAITDKEEADRYDTALEEIRQTNNGIAKFTCKIVGADIQTNTICLKKDNEQFSLEADYDLLEYALNNIDLIVIAKVVTANGKPTRLLWLHVDDYSVDRDQLAEEIKEEWKDTFQQLAEDSIEMSCSDIKYDEVATFISYLEKDFDSYDDGAFKEVIKDAQRILGLSDIELAHMFDASIPTIQSWLNGRNAPHPVIRPKVYFSLLMYARALQRNKD